MGSLLTYLKNEPSFANRSSLSFIDNIYKNQEDSLKNYFKFKSEGLFKVGVLPLFYYNAKAGLGNEKFSAFQLPDTWSTISIYTPNNGDAIYNDAYVDFYSHEGSFQGDVFSKFLNSGVFLSTELIKGALTSIAPGVKNFFSNFTGENGAMGNILGKTTLRDTADDLLFLSHNETCSDCVTSMKFDDTKNKLIVDRFTSKQTINVYILETASTELVDEKGSTLINYAHHTNIGGEVAGNDMKPIDLSQSRTLGLTCEQKLYECDPTASKELGGGLLSWQSKGGTTGGLMQGVETLSYVINPGWGLFFSLLQQLTITSCLQDCVDDKEGYYVHLSVPPSSTTAKAKETSSTAATNLNSSIQGMANFAAENVDKLISSSNSSGAGSAKNSMVSALNNVLKTAQNTKTLYTKLSMGVEGSGFKIGDVQNITGSISAKEIAYIWSGGTISNDPLGSANTPSALTDGKGNSINVLPTDNKIVLEDAQGNKKEINLLNGPELQGNSELAFPKGKGSYPIRTSQLTDLTSLQGNIFEISREGKVFVSNPILLDCIQSAVMAQTGVPLDGAELVSAFGPLSQITYFENTSTGAGVSGVGSSAVSTGVAGNLISTPSTLERILTVNGGVFQLSGAGLNTSIGNVSAKALIDAKLNLSLTDNSTPTPVPIGKFKIMKFNNGVIWVDGANTLHVYLARNEKAILNSKDGQGLTGNPSTTMGADGCEQPAIDLQAQPNLNDALGTVNVSNFNASMQTMGPFTKFQTPDKIYDFYSKKVNGECKNFYRVIDRATGKVLYDKEIVGPLTKGEDGSIKFQTIDGVNHSMKFGTNSNGDPTITVDGKAQENLLSAQGPNGSFYYDPATRNWIPENTFNVNLSDGFKNNGATLGPNGMVPGSPITLNVGNNSDKGGFSIPSAPEDILSRLAMLSLLLIIFSVAFTTMRNKKHEIVIKK
jgi:hypothetical protein